MRILFIEKNDVFGIFARDLSEIFNHMGLNHEPYADVLTQAMLYTLKDEYSSSHLRYERFDCHPFLEEDKEEYRLVDKEYYWSLQNYTTSANSFTMVSSTVFQIVFFYFT